MITGLVGAGIAGITDLSLASGVGQTGMLFGVYQLLMGGIRGGGYNNLSLGAVEALAKRRRQVHDPSAEHYAELRQEEKRRDPMERLRKGLRPPPNPHAFWQVVGGFIYAGAGLLLLI